MLAPCEALPPHLFLLVEGARTGGGAYAPTGSTHLAIGHHASAFKEIPNNPYKQVQ
jgi:hypothetical protein